MSLEILWAENEIKLAIDKEKEASAKDGEPLGWEYGAACYESAMKAFRSLLEDGHSGTSIGFTKNILMRLLDEKCLTPIEDTEDVWGEPYENLRKGGTTYQCKRMSSLFKTVYPDGTVKYNDVNRYYCEDIRTGCTSTFGFAENILDELYPITMPYMPSSKKYVIYMTDFATTGEVGCFDTMAIFAIQSPDDEKKILNLFYGENEAGDFVEISVEEYKERCKMYTDKTNDLTVNVFDYTKYLEDKKTAALARRKQED